MSVFGYLGEFSDETRYYLAAALEHYRYARDMLRRVGPAARARFDEEGWAYGDPSVMGEPEDRVYEAQLATLLYTLFGHRFSADLATVYDIASEASQLADSLVSEDGTPLNERADWVDVGEDLTVVVEVWGSRPQIARLEALLRAVDDRRARRRATLASGLTSEVPGFEIFRYRDDPGPAPPPHRPHVVLLAELGYRSLVELIYDEIFDRFVEGSEVERENGYPNAARDGGSQKGSPRRTRGRRTRARTRAGSRRRPGRPGRRRRRPRPRRRA